MAIIILLTEKCHSYERVSVHSSFFWFLTTIILINCILVKVPKMPFLFNKQKLRFFENSPLRRALGHRIQKLNMAWRSQQKTEGVGCEWLHLLPNKLAMDEGDIFLSLPTSISFLGNRMVCYFAKWDYLLISNTNDDWIEHSRVAKFSKLP